ncbi:hypothetical protein [Nitrosomonas sp.]|uniref:hypothetical protein n=1 Tax=Nitrosomonas sp. TaxID=42353 RepID=UPI0026056419|nr:hypothetical protein [Nitrosomonas sp.]
MNSNREWEQLLCNYFDVVGLTILGSYFADQGFSWQRTKINGIFFRKSDLFVEISYIPETYPNYSPSIIIGIGTDKYDDLGNITGVPAWSIIPETEEARKYSFWKFSNEDELVDKLERIKSEILEKYAKPFLEDRSELAIAIKNFSSSE